MARALGEFSCSKKGMKKNRDPRIMSAARELGRPAVRVFEVNDLRGPDGKHWVGAVSYKERMVAIAKGLNKRDRCLTAVHEMGHLKVNETDYQFGGARFGKELKKTKMYSYLKKEGYPSWKIPEEAFAEYYARSRCCRGNEEGNLSKFRKKYPLVSRKFDVLAERRL